MSIIIGQYLKFFINGGLIGLISIALQALIFFAIGGYSNFLYGVASALTYAPLILINFYIQRRWIFKKEGVFIRFIVTNIFIMFLVSLLAPLLRFYLEPLSGVEWANRLSFAVAAILISPPSFFLQRTFVFK